MQEDCRLGTSVKLLANFMGNVALDSWITRCDLVVVRFWKACLLPLHLFLAADLKKEIVFTRQNN